MRLLFNSINRQSIIASITGFVYLVVLIGLIVMNNRNSMIHYAISPYIYASEPIDFFFSLIVTVPFAVYTFFLKKDHFLDYVELRISQRRYVYIHIVSVLISCMIMVFIVNFIGVIFSCKIAKIVPVGDKPSLAYYILGDMQMFKPIIFGAIWSFYKAIVGAIICLFAQIIALYVSNLFLALIFPFIYVLLENFFTSIIGLSRFSLTTTFVLNRLTPNSMKIGNMIIGILIFVAIIVVTHKILRIRLKNESY